MTELLDRPAGAGEGDGDGAGGADAFRVLGLPYSPDLTDADVHRAFRARLRAVHPDAGGDRDAAAAVTAAYTAVRSGVRRGELLAAAMTDRGDPPAPSWRARVGADAPAPGAARRAELREMVAASRRAQGLPPHITDPATLARIAELMAAMEPGAAARDAARERGPRPAGADWRDSGGVPPGWVSSWRLAGRRRFMTEQEHAESQAAQAVAAAGPSWWRRAWARVRYGRPVVLAVRVVLAAGVVAVAQVAVPGDPAVPGLAVGAMTWLILTGRLDIAPRARRGRRAKVNVIHRPRVSRGGR